MRKITAPNTLVAAPFLFRIQLSSAITYLLCFLAERGKVTKKPYRVTGSPCTSVCNDENKVMIFDPFISVPM